MTREEFDWGYESGPEPFLDHRVIPQARGRCLGGSSSINGMVFVRGHPSDYDGWAADGLTSWDYSHCPAVLQEARNLRRAAPMSTAVVKARCT